jgi:pyruvate formate lyase activating enzyme
LEQKTLVFDIKRDCSEDGPGIRTTVFFKGCPLSCIWCQNPEGKAKSPGLSFTFELCRPTECGTPCLDVCDGGCLQPAKTLNVDHSACTRCDRCFEVCPSKALKPIGYWITLEELLYKVSIDRPFYQSTNGGITLSGGEPTMQMDFIHHFLKELKKRGIHTALETCGFFNLEDFKKQVLPYLDLIYFDLKLIDDIKSRRYTGQSNQCILENFTALVCEAEIPLVPRIPLVPKITATKENLTGISKFLRRHKVTTCSLMPYNPLWQDKLKPLGLTTKHDHSSFMTTAEEKACIRHFYQSDTSTANEDSLQGK